MMKKKVLALTLAAFVACGAAGCGGEEKKPAPKPEYKQTTNVKKDEKQKAPEKKVDPAVKHAQEYLRSDTNCRTDTYWNKFPRPAAMKD